MSVRISKKGSEIVNERKREGKRRYETSRYSVKVNTWSEKRVLIEARGTSCRGKGNEK